MKIFFQNVALKDGWIMRDLWSKVPFSLSNEFYFFNVTNSEAIAKGEKPILKQVGPFVYE